VELWRAELDEIDDHLVCSRPTLASTARRAAGGRARPRDSVIHACSLERDRDSAQRCRCRVVAVARAERSARSAARVLRAQLAALRLVTIACFSALCGLAS
jgi:hypothetical protein